MSGSSPEPDAVTASAGTGLGRDALPGGDRRPALLDRGRAASSENPPWFEPPEVDGSAGPRTSFADADGRVWKYGSAAGSAATGSIADQRRARRACRRRAVTTEPSAGPCRPGQPGDRPDGERVDEAEERR